MNITPNMLNIIDINYYFDDDDIQIIYAFISN